MISYAQNGEDVVLARALPATSGFYVDVGASHPDIASVTRHFYDLGWSGINIEPRSDIIDLLREHRPRDTNLQVAAGSANGSVTFFVVTEDPDLSTMDASDKAYLERRGYTVTAEPVEIRTLDSLLSEFGAKTIDFLKIDVEGSEREVLAGIDLRRWKPRVVVVECVKPWSSERTDESWRDLLESSGYREGGFDGINLYFAQADDTTVLNNLAPASPLDQFQTASEVAVERELTELRRYIRDLESELNRSRHEIEETAAHIRRLGSDWPLDSTCSGSFALMPSTMDQANSSSYDRESKRYPRLAIIGTPHSGDELLGHLLSEALGVSLLDAGHPGEVDWEHLCETVVLNLHWPRSDYLQGILRANGFCVISLARHPFDTLISIYESELRTEDLGTRNTADRTATWNDDRMLSWAISSRVRHLLEMTSTWWRLPSTLRVRYEDLNSNPARTALHVLETWAPEISVDEGSVESLVARNRLHAVPADSQDGTAASTSWEQALNPESLATLLTAYADVLDELGYASSSIAT